MVKGRETYHNWGGQMERLGLAVSVRRERPAYGGFSNIKAEACQGPWLCQVKIKYFLSALYVHTTRYFTNQQANLPRHNTLQCDTDKVGLSNRRPTERLVEPKR